MYAMQTTYSLITSEQMKVTFVLSIHVYLMKKGLILLWMQTWKLMFYKWQTGTQLM